MGLGDFTAIMNKIVEKVCSNLRYWGDTDCVIEVSLRLESVEFLLQNHTVPFEFDRLTHRKRPSSSWAPRGYCRCGTSTTPR